MNRPENSWSGKSKEYLIAEMRFETLLLDLQWFTVKTLFEDYCAKAGFDPNQPRVPAGSSDGGQWTDTGGGSSGGSVGGTLRGGRLPHVPDVATHNRARAIYGETAGVTPQLINPSKSSYDPANWDPVSAKQLRIARIYVGIVSERNHRVHFAELSNRNNPIQARAWDISFDAAMDGEYGTQLDSRITNFFLRQEGIGRQVPPWRGYKKYIGMGPFYNIGGGDIRKGSKAYIDFYGLP